MLKSLNRSINVEKLVPTEKNVVVSLSKFDSEGRVRNLEKVNFQLYSLCEVPILAFQFANLEDITVIPINFRSVDFWPVNENLIIVLRLVDATGAVYAHRELIVNIYDTSNIYKAMTEQLKMTSRQIKAITDYIYCDFVNFARLTEAM